MTEKSTKDPLDLQPNSDSVAADDCISAESVRKPNMSTLVNIKVEGQSRMAVETVTKKPIPKNITSAFKNTLKWPEESLLEKRGKKRSRKQKHQEYPTIITGDAWIEAQEKEEEEKKNKILEKKLKVEKAQLAKKMREEEAFRKKQIKLEKEKIKLEKEQEKLQKKQEKAKALEMEIIARQTLTELQNRMKGLQKPK